MSDVSDTTPDWQSPLTADVAITLLKTGSVCRDMQTAALVDLLLDYEWLEIASAAGAEYRLNSQGRRLLPGLLDQKLPRWQERALAGVEVRSEARSAFMRRLEFIRSNTRYDLPVWLNRRSYNTLYGGHADADLSDDLKALLPQYHISEDVVLRIRGNSDLQLIRPLQKPIRLGPMFQLMSQVIITERDITELTEVDGEQPYLVMTVENLEMFTDMDIPDHLLLLWTPLANPQLAIRLLKLIPQYVPHIHFGDLDSEGLALAEHIAAETGRPMRRFLPDFWQEYRQEYARPCSGTGKGGHWKQAISSHDLIRKLMLRKEWLPQSALLLDPRLRQEIAELMN